MLLFVYIMGGGGGFFRYFLNVFEGNHLSSGIVQSPQGCLCVVGMERVCILAKNVLRPPLSELSGSAPGRWLLYLQMYRKGCRPRRAREIPSGYLRIKHSFFSIVLFSRKFVEV